MQLRHPSKIIGALAASLLSCAHGQSTGRASVDFISTSSHYQAGVPLLTAVRMAYDDGWHGYWINPGETGMKTEITWKLPTGWKASAAEFPLPQRYSSKDLHTFCYHGTILIPVTFTPPIDAEGSAEIEGEVSWLACNENQCVAGNASIKITVKLGASSPTAEADAIQKAVSELPEMSSQYRMTRSSDGKNVALAVEGLAIKNLDGTDIFPITEQALAPGHRWKFSVKNGICSATGPINEYAEEAEQTTLEVVVCGGKLAKPLLLRWEKKM